MTTEYYHDDSTGMLHLTSLEEGTGFTNFDNKGVHVGIGNSTGGVANFNDKMKVVKVHYFCTIHDTAARITAGVKDYNTPDSTQAGLYSFEQNAGSWPVFLSNCNAKKDTFFWSRTWKPDKLALNGDQDVFLCIDPVDIGLTSLIWGFSAGIYVLARPL